MVPLSKYDKSDVIEITCLPDNAVVSVPLGDSVPLPWGVGFVSVGSNVDTTRVSPDVDVLYVWLLVLEEGPARVIVLEEDKDDVAVFFKVEGPDTFTVLWVVAADVDAEICGSFEAFSVVVLVLLKLVLVTSESVDRVVSALWVEVLTIEFSVFTNVAEWFQVGVESVIIALALQTRKKQTVIPTIAHIVLAAIIFSILLPLKTKIKNKF